MLGPLLCILSRKDVTHIRRLIVAFTAICLFGGAAPAQAHYYDGCQKNPCKRHVIKPFKQTFRSIAHCETGGTMNPRIVSPTGQYRGLLQFGFPDWHRAGGKGDPIKASKLEQYYRGVIWLHRNGRQSWPNC